MSTMRKGEVKDVEERKENEPKQLRGFKLNRGTVKPRQYPFLVI
jgi:hypothetical protein